MPYIFPTNYELNQIAPALQARMSQDRLGLQLMPVRDVFAATVEWDQKDNYRGLQQLRGLEGSPTHVKPLGRNRYSYDPGVYGEYQTINELELTKRAGAVVGVEHMPIQVGDLVMDANDLLLQRELDRVEFMNWTLLTTGTFSVSSPSGVVFTDTFTLQTYTAAVAWGTAATATPLADFRGIALLGRGKGASFGAGAVAYMNQTEANKILANTNASDIFGKRVVAGNTPLSINDYNRISVDQGAPSIVVYDEGYYDENNNFQLFLPVGKVVIIGKRAQGQRIGEYVKTLNAVNPGRAPGSYSFVKDMTGNGPDGNRQVPPRIEIHRGHNGGPVIYYPGSVVVLTTV